MNIQQHSANFTQFFWGLGIFAVSASTVALVTDPYVMADVGLAVLGIYLMVTGLKARKLG